MKNLNEYQRRYYAWLDSQGINLLPEFEYNFNCKGWVNGL